MTIGLLKEPGHETRVSLLAEAVSTLTKKGITILVENAAGDKAFCSNIDYEQAGAQIKEKKDILPSADIILSIHQPLQSAMAEIQSKILIGVYQPLYNAGLMQQWANQEITTFSLDMLPRTTRAQAMDVLSSQANIAGYKAAISACSLYPRYFPMFMTAAGSIKPAKVLILGAGVAGL
ncbi:MAG: NAD(P)(+) transhydrogenase (Re/Si-specific) subunit alpha, partial [Chitinophagales bacterium]